MSAARHVHHRALLLPHRQRRCYANSFAQQSVVVPARACISVTNINSVNAPDPHACDNAWQHCCNERQLYKLIGVKSLQQRRSISDRDMTRKRDDNVQRQRLLAHTPFLLL